MHKFPAYYIVLSSFFSLEHEYMLSVFISLIISDRFKLKWE